jgi:hypothetical protein
MNFLPGRVLLGFTVEIEGRLRKVGMHSAPVLAPFFHLLLKDFANHTRNAFVLFGGVHADPSRRLGIKGNRDVFHGGDNNTGTVYL